MEFSIVPFSKKKHLKKTVEALLRVFERGHLYPPPEDVQPDHKSFTNWLLNVPEIHRWVGLVDGQVVGHVALLRPAVYLVNHIKAVNYQIEGHNGLGEVAKLFVDPSFRGRGFGAHLLGHACLESWALGLQPALAVLLSSQDAIELYESEGMSDIGSFMGVHGVNRIFVDEPVKLI